uniref:Uncharacterized protein n=1 Tax=Pinctada fucata TaxID=50426 RepID=A0A194ANV4_PINFU
MESLSTGKRFVHVDGATSRRNLVNCAECCNEKNGCNHQLCNKTSLQTTPTYSRGHVCASCIRVANVSDCRSTICSEDEECFLEKTVTDQLTTEYNAGCRSKTICQIMEQLQGRKRSEEMSKSQGKRRTVVSCAECCADQDLCNKHLCGLV